MAPAKIVTSCSGWIMSPKYHVCLEVQCTILFGNRVFVSVSHEIKVKSGPVWVGQTSNASYPYKRKGTQPHTRKKALGRQRQRSARCSCELRIAWAIRSWKRQGEMVLERKGEPSEEASPHWHLDHTLLDSRIVRSDISAVLRPPANRSRVMAKWGN